MLSCGIDKRRIICLTPFDSHPHTRFSIGAIDLVIGPKRHDIERSGVVERKQALDGFVRDRGIIINEDSLEMFMEALQILGIQMRNGAGYHLVHAKDRVPPLNRDLLHLVLLRLGKISGRCDKLVQCLPLAKISVGNIIDRCEPQTNRRSVVWIGGAELGFEQLEHIV